MKQKIRGKIIRILDKTTIVINLGQIHGITEGSIFGILGDPEIVLDPFTKEELGSVSLLKGRVKAVTVSDKFTIASSKWRETAIYYKTSSFYSSALASLTAFSGGEERVDESDELLRVKSDEIKPWRALSEDYVRIGDDVEVSVEQQKQISNDDDDESNNKKVTDVQESGTNTPEENSTSESQ